MIKLTKENIFNSEQEHQKYVPERVPTQEEYQTEIAQKITEEERLITMSVDELITSQMKSLGLSEDEWNREGEPIVRTFRDKLVDLKDEAMRRLRLMTTAAAFTVATGIMNPSLAQDTKTNKQEKSINSEFEKKTITMSDFEKALVNQNPTYFLEHANDFVGVVDSERIIKEIKRIGEQYPAVFLDNAHKFESIPDLELGKMITQIGMDVPSVFMGRLDRYRHIPGVDVSMVIDRAIESFHEGDFVGQTSWRGYFCEQFFKQLKNGGLKDVPGLDVGTVINRIAFGNAQIALDNIDVILTVNGVDWEKFNKVILHECDIRAKGPFRHGTGSELGFITDNLEAFKKIKGFDAERFSQRAVELLEKYSSDYPNLFFQGFEHFRKIPGTEMLCLTRAQEYPAEALVYDPIKKMIIETKEVETPVIAMMKKITQEAQGSGPVVAMLMEDLVKHNMSLEDAVELVNNRDRYLKKLLEIKATPNHLAPGSVENSLKDICLLQVRKVNDLHEESDAVRFESVSSLSAVEAYSLMVYGEQEIYTSSFNGIFSRLLEKMKAENISGDQLLTEAGQNKWRVFVKECTGFNKLDDFLLTMDVQHQNELLSGIVKNLETSKDKLAQAATVVDIIESSVNNKAIEELIQGQLKLEYDRVKEPADKILYGVLAGIAAQDTGVVNTWCNEMANEYCIERFDLTKIKSKDLFNENKLNVQQYFFYDDEDGRASYASFMSQYKNSGWEIKKAEGITIISSPGVIGKDRKIVICANDPSLYDGDAFNTKEFLPGGLTPSVVVHRGHSYHAQQTIQYIPETTKIVSLGSCGGYNEVASVLEKSKNAHIISTKGTGTMLVNDPLFKMLNMAILSGQDIDWQQLWQKAEDKLGKNLNFRDYVPPYKNSGAIFLNVYNQAIDENKINNDDE